MSANKENIQRLAVFCHICPTEEKGAALVEAPSTSVRSLQIRVQEVEKQVRATKVEMELESEKAAERYQFSSIGDCYRYYSDRKDQLQRLTPEIQRLVSKKMQSIFDPHLPSSESVLNLFLFKSKINFFSEDFRQIIIDFITNSLKKSPQIRELFESLQLQISDDEWALYWADSVTDLAPSMAEDLMLSQQHSSQATVRAVALEMLHLVSQNDFRSFTEERALAYLDQIRATKQMFLFKRMMKICITASFLARNSRDDVAQRWKILRSFFSKGGKEALQAFKGSRVQFSESTVFDRERDSKRYVIDKDAEIGRKYENPTAELLLNAIINDSVEAPDVLVHLIDPCKIQADFACLIIACFSETIAASLDKIQTGATGTSIESVLFFENLREVLLQRNRREEPIDQTFSIQPPPPSCIAYQMIPQQLLECLLPYLRTIVQDHDFQDTLRDHFERYS